METRLLAPLLACASTSSKITSSKFLNRSLSSLLALSRLHTELGRILGDAPTLSHFCSAWSSLLSALVGAYTLHAQTVPLSQELLAHKRKSNPRFRQFVDELDRDVSSPVLLDRLMVEPLTRWGAVSVALGQMQTDTTHSADAVMIGRVISEAAAAQRAITDAYTQAQYMWTLQLLQVLFNRGRQISTKTYEDIEMFCVGPRYYVFSLRGWRSRVHFISSHTHTHRTSLIPTCSWCCRGDYCSKRDHSQRYRGELPNARITGFSFFPTACSMPN